MIAAPTIAAMKRQDLPDHVMVTSQKRRGPRVKVSSAHFTERGRITLARWPEDGMDEYAIPIFACVTGGQADLLIADYALRCQPGDMIYFPPGIPKCNSQKPHFVGDPRRHSCDIFWISPAAPAKGLRCYLCHCRDGQHLEALLEEQCVIPSLFLERLFDGFREELQNKGSGDVAAEILALVLRLFKREIDEDNVFPPLFGIPEDSSVDANLNPIEQACLYIETHLELQMTIKDVARQVYLSPTIFTRRFREHTSQSFKEYLTAQRLKKAVQLLQETDRPVQGVSYYVGLKPGQLRNLFHEHYGCSPAEFRRRHLSL
jgi:AraC-like DNA-binding protein